VIQQSDRANQLGLPHLTSVQDTPSLLGLQQFFFVTWIQECYGAPVSTNQGTIMTRIVLRKSPGVERSRTALYMPADQHFELERIAKANDLSLNALCCQLLAASMEQFAEEPKTGKRRKKK
jgi:hypothetical protein